MLNAPVDFHTVYCFCVGLAATDAWFCGLHILSPQRKATGKRGLRRNMSSQINNTGEYSDTFNVESIMTVDGGFLQLTDRQCSVSMK